MTATYPPGRFGAIDVDKYSKVIAFKEKPKGDGALINAGFFILSSEVLGLIEGDETVWEKKPLEALASSGQLMAYEHEGYW